MQHVVVYFEHKIQDLIPWCELVQQLKPELVSSGTGEFVGDDMAIDGGDCEAVFRGTDADGLYEFLRPRLLSLSFLNTPTTRVELVYGDLESSANTKTFGLAG
jgi:hypothetical protein